MNQSRPGPVAKIVALVDISGSQTPDVLNRIDYLLQGWARTFHIKVIAHEMDVKGVCDFRPHCLDAYECGGGINYRKAFDRAMEENPLLILSFTDGFGDRPINPGVPVIWYITDKVAHKPAEWGFVVPNKEWQWSSIGWSVKRRRTR